MKVAVTFPPILSEKGIPLLTQNRQFQFFKDPTYIYPMIPSYLVSMLQEKGHEVLFLDGIAEEISFDDWISKLKGFDPDFIVLETKTPVIAYYWNIVDKVKSILKESKIILCGDHVTAFPEETLTSCKVDLVCIGGDFDFIITDFIEYCRENKIITRDAFLSIKKNDLPGSIYLNTGVDHIFSGKYNKKIDLNLLPFIDRDLTKYKNYAYYNGNYKRVPGTYMMSARDCHWHKCTFCSWTTLFPEYHTMSVERALNEYEHCVNNYQIREIMDDSGSFPPSAWARKFSEGIIDRNIHKKIYIDCNARFDQFDFEDYKKLKKANFRFLLFGLESANNKTLERVKKGVTAERIEVSIRDARRAGLYPHITVMFGYPWETESDIEQTLAFARKLMLKGYAYTMQATMVIPYPGTPLYNECQQQGLLKDLQYADYDMRTPVMKVPFAEEKIFKAISDLYKTAFHPRFVMHKLASIRDFSDIAYFLRAFYKVSKGHLKDFSFKRN